MTNCPGYISNLTTDICIGDVLITSEEFAYTLIIWMIIIFAILLAVLFFLKNNKSHPQQGDGSKTGDNGVFHPSSSDPTKTELNPTLGGTSNG